MGKSKYLQGQKPVRRGGKPCLRAGTFQVGKVEIEIEEAVDITTCAENNTQNGTFDLTGEENALGLSGNQEIIGYYTSVSNAKNEENPISNSTEFLSTEIEKEIFIRVESENPCYKIYTFKLVIENCGIFIPQGFSPNGDGINDSFVISNLHKAYPNFEMKIFSRYGTIVYEEDQNKAPWNGYSENGRKLPSATYFYVLKLHDESNPKDYRGWVYLNR